MPFNLMWMVNADVIIFLFFFFFALFCLVFSLISLHRQKSRTFCSRIHWSAEYVILQWDKNKMAARTSKTDQGRDKFHTKY